MKPKDIKPNKLPFVKLEDKKNLPEESGIYFAIDSQGTVQYIGRSNNLKNRWNGHHRQSQLEKLGGVKVAYLLVSDCSLLDEIEQALIEWFNPFLNGAKVDYSDRDPWHAN